jgi:ABC-type transport system involved in multi-copper enzyme maturation permease subunit
MANLAGDLLGPLAGPECRRALGRGWLIAVRSLAAVAMLGALLIILWYWWMNQASDLYYSPFETLRYGLVTVEGMLLTVALVLGPAVLAGSIAGEKERGVMALLLTTRVSPREIILGRLTGKLTQVAMVLLAGVPALVAVTALAGMGPKTLAVLLALPAAVAVGGGGLAVFASTVSRRGRDALLAVYMLDVFFLLSPLAGFLRWSSARGLGALNPFVCLFELVWREALTPALVSSALWLAIGAAGAVVAALRLRPASLRPLDAERVARRGKRRGRIPAVNERRPMLWKELYIERAGALGGPGWLLGAALAGLLGGGSLALGAMIAWGALTGEGSTWEQPFLAVAIGGSATYIGWLIQWAVGLRAAVTISSERERGTWDAILTSPLDGSEIVWAKVWGSLHALRWLFAATLLAWTIAVSCTAMNLDTYVIAIVGTAINAAFMAAVGVRTSLAAPTATRAMALTIGIWLGAWVVVAFVSAIVIAVGFLIGIATIGMATMGNVAPPRWLTGAMRYSWPIVTNGLYLMAALSLIADTRLRFDRLSGRMTAGRLATAVDAMIHGRPTDPWSRREKPAAEPELTGWPPPV